jgi:acyl transferase domain-containing protein
MTSDAIAIIGIGCRFPGGAQSPDEFWKMLCDGVDGISEVPADRWNVDAFYRPPPIRPGKTVSKWGGFVEGIEDFDCAFFGISPREAPWIDPQQRMLLEASWEALEDGGQVVDSENGSPIGIFVGIATSDYRMMQSVGGDPTTKDPYATTGGAQSIAANRISYCLNLSGPSVAVDTACSSSLVALHLACLSLRQGECEIALAAGVNALLTPTGFISLGSLGMLSPNGRCRAFDASADGFVRGEGVGAVALKQLPAAIDDGDPIYAVIRGSGLNQDGRTVKPA